MVVAPAPPTHGELAAGLGRCDELSLPPEFQPLFRSTISTQPFGSPLPNIHHRVDGFLALFIPPPLAGGPRNHPHEIGGADPPRGDGTEIGACRPRRRDGKPPGRESKRADPPCRRGPEPHRPAGTSRGTGRRLSPRAPSPGAASKSLTRSGVAAGAVPREPWRRGWHLALDAPTSCMCSGAAHLHAPP